MFSLLNFLRHLFGQTAFGMVTAAQPRVFSGHLQGSTFFIPYGKASGDTFNLKAWIRNIFPFATCNCDIPKVHGTVCIFLYELYKFTSMEICIHTVAGVHTQEIQNIRFLNIQILGNFKCKFWIILA